ncbi:MAG: hypothetical protein KIT28_13680, partial [Rubrivivax sp.]|nr:hypothetical protein [Rubrivivax sp.]
MPATSVAGLAADGWPWLFAMVALGAMAVVAFRLGRLQQLRDDTETLRATRARQQLLDQLLDVWQWQTDRNHRLLRLQPPSDAPAAAWAAPAGGGQPLWERFDASGDPHAGLRAQLEAMAPLRD